MWELLTFEPPFAELSTVQLLLAVGEQRARPHVPRAEDAARLAGGTFAGLHDYMALMQRCWAEAPGDRPSFEEAAFEIRRIGGGRLEGAEA